MLLFPHRRRAVRDRNRRLRAGELCASRVSDNPRQAVLLEKVAESLEKERLAADAVPDGQHPELPVDSGIHVGGYDAASAAAGRCRSRAERRPERQRRSSSASAIRRMASAMAGGAFLGMSG